MSKIFSKKENEDNYKKTEEVRKIFCKRKKEKIKKCMNVKKKKYVVVCNKSLVRKRMKIITRKQSNK